MLNETDLISHGCGAEHGEETMTDCMLHKERLLLCDARLDGSRVRKNEGTKEKEKREGMTENVPRKKLFLKRTIKMLKREKERKKEKGEGMRKNVKFGKR